MKTREEIARFIESQMDGKVLASKHSHWHYGRVEVRQLTDFIFDGPPTCEKDKVFTPGEGK